MLRIAMLRLAILRIAAIIGLFPLLLLGSPATAATKEQKLEGAKRKAFMTRCTLNKDDKRGPAMAPPADKK